jgi:hypothetical protein
VSGDLQHGNAILAQTSGDHVEASAVAQAQDMQAEL